MGRMPRVPKWAGHGWGQSQTKAHSAGERRGCCRLLRNAYLNSKSSFQNYNRYALLGVGQCAPCGTDWWRSRERERDGRISYISWASLWIQALTQATLFFDRSGWSTSFDADDVTNFGSWKAAVQRLEVGQGVKARLTEMPLGKHLEKQWKMNLWTRWWIIMMKFHSMFLKTTYCLTLWPFL